MTGYSGTDRGRQWLSRLVSVKQRLSRPNAVVETLNSLVIMGQGGCMYWLYWDRMAKRTTYIKKKTGLSGQRG